MQFDEGCGLRPLAFPIHISAQEKKGISGGWCKYYFKSNEGAAVGGAEG